MGKYDGQDDFMEMGDSNLVPQEDGWFLDTDTGNRVDEDGRVFDQEGDLLWDPELEEGYDR